MPSPKEISYEVALEEILKSCDEYIEIAELNPKAFIRIVRSIAKCGLATKTTQVSKEQRNEETYWW